MQKPEFTALTINERLVAAGLLASFENAVRQRDRERMVTILEQVDLDDQAAQVVDTVLADPTTYGF